MHDVDVFDIDVSLRCLEIDVSVFCHRSMVTLEIFILAICMYECVATNTIDANCKFIFGLHYCDYIFLYQINKLNWWGSVQWPKRFKTKICTFIIWIFQRRLETFIYFITLCIIIVRIKKINVFFYNLSFHDIGFYLYLFLLQKKIDLKR